MAMRASLRQEPRSGRGPAGVSRAPAPPNRVVDKRIEAEEKTTGGIIIPDTAKEKPMQGQIIAVGPGGRDETGKLIPIDVKGGGKGRVGKGGGGGGKLGG